MLNTLIDFRAEALGKAYDAGTLPPLLLVAIKDLPMLWRRMRRNAKLTDQELWELPYVIGCLNAEAEDWLA